MRTTNSRWLILSHAFNMDGRAASHTITDKIPYLRAAGVDPVVLKPIAWHDVPLKARRVGPAREVKSCTICGATFEPKGNRQRYCESCAQNVRRAAKRKHAKEMRASALGLMGEALKEAVK